MKTLNSSKKTKAEQHRFYEVYKTVKQVKDKFLQNVHAKPAEKLNKELSHFKLPTLPGIKDEFWSCISSWGFDWPFLLMLFLSDKSYYS